MQDEGAGTRSGTNNRAVAGMSDYRQQQEIDEQQAFLWHSLNNLRGHISAEVFQAAEQQLGFNDRRKLNEKGNEHGIRQGSA